MNIKFYALLTLLISASLSAQTTEPGKTRFALIGGVNFQNLNGTNASGDKTENSFIVGFHAGFNVMVPIAPDFYFQPGLLFSTKGGNSDNDSFSNKYKLSYIEMPLNFVYRAPLGDGFFLLGFGPYLGYGIKAKQISNYNNVEKEDDITFKNITEITDPVNPPNFRAFDAGANIFAGYEMASGLFFQLNTQLGLVKINPENKRIPNDQTSTKNTGFGLSLGYRF